MNLIEIVDKYKLYKIMNLEINSDIINFLDKIYSFYEQIIESYL